MNNNPSSEEQLLSLIKDNFKKKRNNQIRKLAISLLAGLVWGVLCYLFTKNIGLSILIMFIKSDISIIASKQ